MSIKTWYERSIEAGCVVRTKEKLFPFLEAEIAALRARVTELEAEKAQIEANSGDISAHLGAMLETATKLRAALAAATSTQPVASSAGAEGSGGLSDDLQQIANMLKGYADNYDAMARQSPSDQKVNMTSVAWDIRQNMHAYVLGKIAARPTVAMAVNQDKPTDLSKRLRVASTNFATTLLQSDILAAADEIDRLAGQQAAPQLAGRTPIVGGKALILDAACKQGKCAQPTTGCWGQCYLADPSYSSCVTVIAEQQTVAVLDVDHLSNFIRAVDGNNSMGAGALAERICDWLTTKEQAK